MSVRQLGSADATAFRDLRLRGLALHPDAFGSSYDEAFARPLDLDANALAEGFVAGYQRGGELVGILGLHRTSAMKTRHRGVVWGMFVAPEARRLGVANALLSVVIEEARAELEALTLRVSAHNTPAISLYRRTGFQEYGLDLRALKVGGKYVDELLMQKTL